MCEYFCSSLKIAKEKQCTYLLQHKLKNKEANEYFSHYLKDNGSDDADLATPIQSKT
jgi:hypothetical protein